MNLAPVNLANAAPALVLAQGQNAAATGFLDLIGLLLASPSPQVTEETAEQAAVLPQLASPDQIAAALIKSMSKSPTAGVLPATVALGKKIETSIPAKVKELLQKQTQQANPAQATVLPILQNSSFAALTSLPQISSLSAKASEGANVAKSATQTQLFPTPGVADATVAVAPTTFDSNSPIAFQMLLTPQSAQAQQAETATQPGPLLKPGGPQESPVEPMQPTSASAKAGLRAPVQPPEEPEKVLAAAALAASADHAPQGNLSQAPFHQPAAPQVLPRQALQSGDAPAPSPEIKAADQPAQLKPGSAQQITVRVSSPQTPAVDLHVVQRAGQVEVAVRTPDAGLEAALRQDLGTLVHSLERSGFHTETFVPVSAAASTSSAQMNSQGDRSDTHPDFSQNRQGQNSGGQNQGGQSRREDSSQNQRHAAWAAALEKDKAENQ